jgi:hypothetical protein
MQLNVHVFPLFIQLYFSTCEWYRWQLKHSAERIKDCISKNPSLQQKHPGVPDGSERSDRTLQPLMENYMIPLTQATSCIAHLTVLVCLQNVSMYTHLQDTPVLYSCQGPKLYSSLLHNVRGCLWVSPAKCYILLLHYCYISDAALSPSMLMFINKMYLGHWEPLSVSGSCQTRIPGWPKPRDYWTDALVFRCTLAHLGVWSTGLGVLTRSVGAPGDKPVNTNH